MNRTGSSDVPREDVNVNTTYVCGHRNPDTDAIVSAMAYASLMNTLGENGYIAARLGQLNDETSFLLRKFGFSHAAYDRAHTDP